MLITIGGIQQNVDVTSHVLEADPDNPNMMNLFHCWRCGKSIFQFSGRIIMSAPGEIFTKLPIMQLCKTCKKRHLIVSIL